MRWWHLLRWRLLRGLCVARLRVHLPRACMLVPWWVSRLNFMQEDALVSVRTYFAVQDVIAYPVRHLPSGTARVLAVPSIASSAIVVRSSSTVVLTSGSSVVAIVIVCRPASGMVVFAVVPMPAATILYEMATIWLVCVVVEAASSLLRWGSWWGRWWCCCCRWRRCASCRSRDRCFAWDSSVHACDPLSNFTFVRYQLGVNFIDGLGLDELDLVQRLFHRCILFQA